MKSYFDKWSRLHHKPCIDGEPAGNNGWLFSAYYHKAGGKLDFVALAACARQCKQVDPDTGRLFLVRSPFKELPPFSRDELLGMTYLGFLKSSRWNFSPFPLPRFSFVELVKQLWECKGKHRNYFWQNNLSQVYHVAFSVPLQDRAFLLECWGETKSLRYFFYKGIALLDAKFSKPKNGIHWLKYGGEERKRIMQAEFPEGHPLREI